MDDLAHNSLDLAGEDAPADLSEKQEVFLEAVSIYGCGDGTAALFAGVSRWTPWRWKKDPAFVERYKAARKIGLSQLIAEAERRAMRGSDRLLEFLLLNYAPEKFSNKQKIEVEDKTLFDRLTRARARTGAVSPSDGSDLAGEDGSDLAG